MTGPQNASRRDFLKTTAVGGAVASALGYVPMVHAAGSGTISVSLKASGRCRTSVISDRS